MSSATSDHIERLRSIVQDSLGKHLYENAIFFADKLVTLSGGEPDDIYRLAQAYMYTKQHRRALHVLHRSHQATASPRFRYLTAKCLAECLELDECLATLDDAALLAVGEEAAVEGGGDGQVSMLAAMQLLRGSVYESQENWPLAARCYTAALHADALCYEALDRLVSNHMISTAEQRALLETLEPKLQAASAEWLRVYYRCKLEPDEGRLLSATYLAEEDDEDARSGLGAAGIGGGIGIGVLGHGSEEAARAAAAVAAGGAGGERAGILELRENVDMLTAAAEYEYAHDHFRACYKLSSRVLSKDPFQQHVSTAAVPCPPRSPLRRMHTHAHARTHTHTHARTHTHTLPQALRTRKSRTSPSTPLHVPPHLCSHVPSHLPLHLLLQVLPVHVCSMVRLDYRSELFSLAHQVISHDLP